MKKIVLIIVSFVMCLSFAGLLKAQTMHKLGSRVSEVQQAVIDKMESVYSEMDGIIDELNSIDCDDPSDQAEMQVLSQQLEIKTKDLNVAIGDLKVLICEMLCHMNYAEGSMSYQTCITNCVSNVLNKRNDIKDEIINKM